MKVLFLAPQPFYRLRGMCIAQRKVLENLSKAGFEVDLLTFPFGTDIELPGLRIMRFPALPGITDIPIGPSISKLVYDVLLFLYLPWAFLTRGYDAVHACEESAFVAAFYKGIFSFRLIYDMDDVISRRLKASGFLRSRSALAAVEWLEVRAIRACDSVLTNSENTTKYASSLRPDGVLFYDHIPHFPTCGRSPAWDNNYTVVQSRVIMYAGNLEPYQGIDLLLEAIRILAAPGNLPVRCLVIGGEPWQISAYRDKAEALGVGRAVDWAGKLDIEETFEKLSGAAVLVSPMVQDKAVPSKIYLYMAAGRPIVATDIANHSELLGNGTAVIVAPEAQALAAGLAKVLESPALSREISEKAYFSLKSIMSATDLSLCVRRAYGQ